MRANNRRAYAKILCSLNHSLGMLRLRVPIAGGNWNNGSNAGLFALNLNNVRGNSNNNIGGRVA
jgi:hypothetical protein